MEKIQYDRKVIYTFAEAMYAKAKSIVISETVKYAFIGSVVFLVATAFGLRSINPSGFLYFASFLFGGVTAGYFGYQNGLMKSFHLKLEAQRALCFAQIEANMNSKESFKEVA